MTIQHLFLRKGLFLYLLTFASSFVSYPLIPQHFQRERRLRYFQQENNNNNNSSISSSEPLVFNDIRRREVAQQVGALYQGYGTHYVDLWCGTPPQRQTVIVDTGSGVTAFPCDPCEDGCGVPDYHVDKLFDPDKSSTFRENTCGSCRNSRAHCQSGQCQISMSYAEGSRWYANEAIDKCYVGGPHHVPLLAVQDNNQEGTEGDDLDPKHASQFAFDLTFGCQTRVTGLFVTQLADGIMGMSSQGSTFWNQMFETGKMGDNKQFALCFSRQPTAERKGTEAGALTLGGVDPRLHDSDMVYSSNASSGRASFFSVKVRAVYLRQGSAGESAKSNKADPTEGVVQLIIHAPNINTGGIIVDSGTTDTYWNKNIQLPFQQAYHEMTGKQYNHEEVSLTKEELDAMPTILFQFEANDNENPSANPNEVVGLAGELDPDHPHDVILAFPPSHYMEYDPETGKYVSRFFVTEGRGSVLGANAMMGHDVFFDLENDRIGWAESSCDYTKVLIDNGYPSVLSEENPLDDTPASSGSSSWEESTSESESSSESFLTFVEACDTMQCRGVIVGCFLVSLCCCVCLIWVRCRSSSSELRYQRANAMEVEMSNGAFSSYKNVPVDEDDEYEGSDEFAGDFS
jgi:hypothetical protein